MAYTNIDDPSAHFQIATYTGAGAGQTVTNDGNSNLQPDWLWIKRRNAGYAHALFDSNRGLGSSNPPMLESDSNAVENNNQNWISGVGTDGFTIGINEQNLSNTSGTYVAWQWKANGGTTSTNTDGDINSTVQVNSDAGFSIVTYNPSNTTTRNIGHGLGVKPDCILIRNRTRVENWRMWFNVIGQGALTLDGTAAYTVNANLVNSATTSTFNVGGDFSVNGNYPYVAYCFASKQGYSKFGKYAGNGNTSGPFVYTGFKPAFVMIKVTSAVESWTMFDGARKPFNRDDNVASLYANTAGAEYTGASYHNIDILSNGFKVRLTNTAVNASGGTYIYMAFAENPFTTSTGIPTTAR